MGDQGVQASKVSVTVIVIVPPIITPHIGFHYIRDQHGTTEGVLCVSSYCIRNTVLGG